VGRYIAKKTKQKQKRANHGIEQHPIWGKVSKEDGFRPLRLANLVGFLLGSGDQACRWGNYSCVK
jgi:hypothetical protein